jgi:hypothetical protein
MTIVSTDEASRRSKSKPNGESPPAVVALRYFVGS